LRLPKSNLPRGEEFVFHEDIRSGQAAKKRWFADIGVCHNGGIGDRRAFAILALGGADATHGLGKTAA
jgi:hypothetical protein